MTSSLLRIDAAAAMVDAELLGQHCSRKLAPFVPLSIRREILTCHGET